MMLDSLRRNIIKRLLWGRNPVYPVKIKKGRELFLFLTPDGDAYISDCSGGAVHFSLVWDEDSGMFIAEAREWRC